MPRRFTKRRRFGMGLRFRKRRRVGVGRRYRRRLGQTRSRVFRRFRRRFQRSRGRKGLRRFGRRKFYLSKRKLNFKLAQLRSSVQTIGQQHTVPNASSGMECIYFMTEDHAIVNIPTQRTQVVTLPLCGIHDVLAVSAWAWVNNPTNPTASGVPGWTHDMAWGHIYLKGRDKYTLRNQSNETVRITCYYCVGRKDAIQWTAPPMAGSPSVQTVNNVYNKLGLGFAEAGLNQSVPNALNAYLSVDEQNPFHSKYFVRHYKIRRTRTIVINPGKVKELILGTQWKRYTPADLTEQPSGEVNWDARKPRYDTIRGERFILFKLHGNIGGIVDQTALQKAITNTTPTIIMKTERRYWFKHQPIVIGSDVNFTESGFLNQDASIIVDADEQKGAEIDAS